MKLNQQDKINLLSAAKKVYSAYTALELFKSRTFVTTAGQQTLYDLCQQSIKTKKNTRDVVLNGLHYQLNLIPENNSYQVRFSRLLSSQTEPLFQEIQAHSDNDALSLLMGQTFRLHLNEKDGQLAISNKLSEQLNIGGLDKEIVSAKSLNSLFTLIQKIAAEEDQSNLFVGLDSDKAQIQALWILILSLSKHNGVFALPNSQMPELINRLKKLLPEELINSLLLLEDKIPNPQTHFALKNLRQPETKGQIILASSAELIDNHYEALDAALVNSTFLFIDEEHLMLETERRRVRLADLAKNKLTLFLKAQGTAEPYLFSAPNDDSSPDLEELGKRLSLEICTWLNQHFDVDETINPERLKRQVLRFIVHILRELNNKNGHQIKLSRAQLKEVIGYAMLGLETEIARINNPTRAGASVLKDIVYFFSEAYYFFKRLPATARLYYHTWLKQVISPADKVYLKIIENTDFKEMVTERESLELFKEWIDQKNTGLIRQLDKNLSDYLAEEPAAEYSLHQQQFLESLLIHSVVDAKKKQLRTALAKLPSSFFHARFAIINALYLEKTVDALQFKTALLAVLQDIPGLNELQSRDLIFYPERKILIEQLAAQATLQSAAQMPFLMRPIANRMALYLQNEFIAFLPSLIGDSHARLIQQTLAKDKNAEVFAQYLLKQINSGIKVTPECLVIELKQFFKLDLIRLLNEDLKLAQSKLIAIQEQIRVNVIGALDEPHLDNLAQIIVEQMLPYCISFYPDRVRARLFAEACDITKIKKFLITEGAALKSWAKLNEQQLAEYIFSQLVKGHVPSTINFDWAKSDAQIFVAEQFEIIRNTGVIDLFTQKISAFSSWSLNSHYLYDKAIADFFQSEQFFSAISIMLSYDQALKLKHELKQNFPRLILIARELIDAMAKNKGSSPSLEELLDLFNKHFIINCELPHEGAKKARAVFISEIEKINTRPLDYVAKQTKTSISDLGQKQFLPALASYIKDEKKKQVFLKSCADNEFVFAFMIEQEANLTSLSSDLGGEQEELVLQLINQIVPLTQELTREDIQTPITQSARFESQLTKDIDEKIILSFLSSPTFHDLLKESYNESDYALLLTVLSVDKNLLEVAEQLINDKNTLNQAQIVAVLKAKFPSLASIRLLDQRAQDFANFHSALELNPGLHYAPNKISGLMLEQFSPVLFHRKFIESITHLLGFLNEDDLLVLLTAMGKPNPEEEAKNCLRFISLLREKNKNALAQEFMILPSELSHFDLGQTTMKQMLSTLDELIDEVLDSHCYFNGYGRKADLAHVTPQIHTQLSPELVKIRGNSSDSYFNRFARKSIYAHAVDLSFVDKEGIREEANQYKLKALNQVKAHILQPLWWSSNLEQFTHRFVKRAHDFIKACEGYWIAFASAFKGDKYDLGIQTERSDENDFTATAFDFTESLNKLKSLTKQEVIKADCPIDQVVSLEEFINQRPSKIGFFAGNLGPVEKEMEVLLPSPNI